MPKKKEEKWVKIKEEDLEDYYWVSSLGHVKSEDKKIISKNGTISLRKGKLLTITNNKVNLSRKGKNSTLAVNVAYLVAKYHVKKGSNDYIYEHINGDTSDNRAENLKWTTAQNNPNYDDVVSLDGELWKYIPGFEGMYQASNLGRIKSVPRNIKRKTDREYLPQRGILLNKSQDAHGYEIVSIKKDDETSFKTYKVHRLIASTFIANPENKPQVDHIDHNRINNCASNLRWVTEKENSCNGASDSVLSIDSEGNSKLFMSVRDASEFFQLSHTTISTLCNRKGCKSKTGVEFQWANEKTKKSKTAKRNKSKGNSLELEVIKRLKEIGFPNCVSSRSQSKRVDNDKIDIIDLDNTLPVNIQTKHTMNSPMYFNIRDACSDRTKPFTIIWKKSAPSGSVSPGTVAIIPIDFFYDLLRQYSKLNLIKLKE